jgi:teichuronic acid biosynthesis glycosyltransferase TuaC
VLAQLQAPEGSLNGKGNSKKNPYRVLVLSRNYPNRVTPLLGLWVEGLVRSVAENCDVRVVAPTPYCPPLPGLSRYKRFRQVALQEQLNGVEVFHPRFLAGPGYSLHDLEAKAYYWSIRNQIDQIRRTFPFDLIHAHFGYPDGVVAARFARRYRVPFVITEHALWRPWMDDYPRVRRQAVWASGECAFHIAVSGHTRDTISHFTGQTDRLRVIHNGVDGAVFTPLPDDRKPVSNQILYVGVIRHVKGVDVLLRAMRRLVDRQPAARLVLVGGGLYKSYLLEENRLRNLARELDLTSNVEFVGLKSPIEVAKYMRESTMLVLPSRRETFGAVLIESLACGTPVIATNCGGPSEIVNHKVGLLVPVEDVEALANAMATLLERRENYDSAELRSYALGNFSWKRVADQTLSLYSEAIERRRTNITVADETKLVRSRQGSVEGSWS